MSEVFDDVNEFYQWANAMFCNGQLTTHPLNWLTIARHSNIFDSIDKSELPGIKPMILSARKQLVGRKYKYVVSPFAFRKLKHKPKMLHWEPKKLFPYYIGRLEFENNDFVLTKFEKTKIHIKYAWILEEIKNKTPE